MLMTFRRPLLFLICAAAAFHVARGEKVASEKEARAAVVFAPRPEYPFEARRDNITGSGIVVIRINPATGLVTKAEVARSTGSRILDNAALLAFRQWRFKPGTLSAARLPITFTLAAAAPNQPRPILPETLVRSLYAGTSITGQRLNASELEPLMLYKPMPMGIPAASLNWRLKVGVFLLTVRPEGTVGKVETLQSTGHSGLDGEIIGNLKRWRFRPNSVKEVRVPAEYMPRPLH
jgi:TonB family protein